MAIVPIDDDLVARATSRGAELSRDRDEQINYWVRLGIEVDPGGTADLADDP